MKIVVIIDNYIKENYIDMYNSFVEILTELKILTILFKEPVEIYSSIKIRKFVDSNAALIYLTANNSSRRDLRTDMVFDVGFLESYDKCEKFLKNMLAELTPMIDFKGRADLLDPEQFLNKYTPDWTNARSNNVGPNTSDMGYTNVGPKTPNIYAQRPSSFYNADFNLFHR